MRQPSETMAGYEDTLIVFLIRLAQLHGKPSGSLAAPAADTSAVPGAWGAASMDTDASVAYLAVIRQFWVRNEPTSYRNIARILLRTAHQLRDRDLQRRVRALGRAFRQHAKRTVTLAAGGFTVRVPAETLAGLWFNQLYFHTDLNSVDDIERLLADGAMRIQARAEFAAFLESLIHYARQLGVEAVNVLDKRALPKGRLHHLVESGAAWATLAVLEEQCSPAAVR